MSDLSAILRKSFFEALTGAGGVVVSAYIVFPIDFIKTRMQIPHSSQSNQPQYQYSGLIDGIKQVIEKEGWMTLYQGVESELIKGSIQNFLYLFCYELLKQYAVNQPMLLSSQSVNQSNNQKVSHQRPLINQSTHCHCHGSNTVGIRYAFRKLKQSVDQSGEQSNGQSTDDESIDQSINQSIDQSDDEYDLVEAKRHIVKVLPNNHSNQSIDQSLDSTLKAINDSNQSCPHDQSINQSISQTAHPPQLSIASNLLVGMLAGCFTQLFVNPLSVIQTRIMTTSKQSNNRSNNQSMYQTARSIYQNEGFKAFYAGLVPSLILTSNPAIQYLVFDRLKRLIDRLLVARLIDRSISALESFVIGAIAKITATLATYPYIMAKLRMQYKPNQTKPSINQSNNQSNNQSTTTVGIIYQIIQNEGFTGLYTGLKAQLLKSVLGAALMFMFKEKFAQLIRMMIRSVSHTNDKSKKHSKSQPADQSIDQSNNQSNNQSINQSNNQTSLNEQSTNQSINQSTDQVTKTTETPDIVADGQPKQIA